MTGFRHVFVLCTGRCGSTTFANAASHITNYTAAHESRTHLIGNSRLAYPVYHIEADNRLTWFLGRLDETFGNDAFYVHLQRDIFDTAKSFKNRLNSGIIKSYYTDILMGASSSGSNIEALNLCIDYCHTVNKNIEQFLKDKNHKMNFHLEASFRDFPVFWESIGAQGDFNKAMTEWESKYNASSNK